jgi:hypothetical protein
VRPKSKPLPILLVKRVVLLLSIMGAVTIFLYGIGTAQDFLESTQLGLLRLSASLGILLFCAAACGFMLDVAYALVRRAPRNLWGAFAYLFAFALGVSIALFSNGVLVLVAGNSA